MCIESTVTEHYGLKILVEAQNTHVERSIGSRTQSIIGRGYKEVELSQVNSCDTVSKRSLW